MGRKPTVNINLPPRMRRRVKRGHVYYYYDAGGKPRKEITLGSDYLLAIQKWSELHISPPTAKLTIGWAIAKYLDSAQYGELGHGSQADYKFALDKLLVAFGDAPLDEVRPSHVTIYIDKRSKESKHRALREKMILSMVYNWCMARDFCLVNPVAAIKTKRLPGRKHIDATDGMELIYEKAAEDLKDAMDLAFYTGQRPADVLKMQETDIKDGVLVFSQDKTRKAMRIAVTGGLEELVMRMLERKRKYAVRALALLVDTWGKPMTKPKLRLRFEAAREAAGDEAAHVQFRDMRRVAASTLRDQGGIQAAQALLGHSSPEMTAHYAGGRAQKVTAIPQKTQKIRGSQK